MINETAVLKNKPVAGCRVLFIFVGEAAESSDIIKVNAERSITEYVEWLMAIPVPKNRFPEVVCASLGTKEFFQPHTNEN